MQYFLKLLGYIKPYWGKFLLATLAMLAVGLLQSAIGALIVPIFDQAFASTGSAERTPTLFGLQHLIPTTPVEAWQTIAVLLILFTFAKGVTEYFSTYLMAEIGQGSIVKLRRDLYSHIFNQSAAFFERHRTNYLVSRIVTSTAAIENAVTHTLRDIIREGFQLIVFLSASFYYSWRLTLSALLIGPVIALITAGFGKRLRKLAKESFEGNQQLIDTAQEALANQNTVKAYRAEEHEKSRFHTVTEVIRRANLRTARILGFAPPTIEMIGVVVVAILLFIGQQEIIEGRMNASQFLTFLFFLFSSYDPIRKLSRLSNGMEQAVAAARHVWEVLDDHESIPEKENAVKLAPLRAEIEFRNVYFNYASHDASVLKDINLKIGATQMVALVGESGGGKSTLTKLIMRFYDPTEGKVLWDGTDLRDAKLQSLRENIALVTQETVLFNDTVEYNIRYGRPFATREEVEEAARIALAHDFITRLPHAYKTVVGERGIFLSGGQRQRIAIARAVLANAPVLVLDEATSALDSESESLVQKALSNLCKGRTTVVIAHRLSTVRKADLIVVIDKGRIIETGTHMELLEKSGQYKRLYDLQFAHEEEVMA
jgi:ATP-binding cassette, subfamily B, bacterial MsbA